MVISIITEWDCKRSTKTITCLTVVSLPAWMTASITQPVNAVAAFTRYLTHLRTFFSIVTSRTIFEKNNYLISVQLFKPHDADVIFYANALIYFFKHYCPNIYFIMLCNILLGQNLVTFTFTRVFQC